MQKKNWILLALAAGVLAFWWFRYKVPPVVEFDAIRLETSEGSSQAFSEIAKAPVIVHFYASWCGPCMQELPELSSYASSSGHEILLITDDSWDKISAARERYQLRIARVNSLKELGVYSIPVTYFINRRGETAKKHLGSWPWLEKNAQQEITQLLNN